MLIRGFLRLVTRLGDRYHSAGARLLHNRGMAQWRAAAIGGVILLASVCSAQDRVFVFVQRTAAHVGRSSSKVFQQVRDDLLAHLAASHVAIATDSLAGKTSSETEVPLETVQRIARDNRAEWLLVVTVDRPVWKWINIGLRCYDASGQLLWEDSAANGSALTGRRALQSALDRLHQIIDKRSGQRGLPTDGAP